MAAIGEADAIAVVRDRTPFKADLLAKLPKLRYLVYTGARNTQLDAAAFAARGIPVSHTEKDPGKDSTAEHTWALILAAARRLEADLAMVREGRWRDGGPLAAILRGRAARPRRLRRDRPARGARRRGLRHGGGHLEPAHDAGAGGRRAGRRRCPLEELLATSKVVSLHLVPSETTRKLLDAPRLATMRPDSILVNTSRSTLVDMAALPAALAAGRPGIAALDVFDEEPLPADFPLREAPQRGAHAARGLRGRARLRDVRPRHGGVPGGLARGQAPRPRAGLREFAQRG